MMTGSYFLYHLTTNDDINFEFGEFGRRSGDGA